ncbi:hypothetical protein LBMAG53_09100 [Planctomycetota bacterium]|nr:hypothetical protein LBMAG53_09100 [Planctomycetota bacterium]
MSFVRIPELIPIDRPVPDRGDPAWGDLRQRVLDAVATPSATGPHRVEVPAPVRSELLDFLEAVRRQASGQAQGLNPDRVPGPWRERLAWAGMPFANDGKLLWEELEPSTDPAPTFAAGRLRLSEPEGWRQLTSLALKPLRQFVAERFGFRLQCATGVRAWRWPGVLVLVSGNHLPVAGFVHCCQGDERTSIYLDPGDAQLIAM